jgi:diguanylate cyclase (GGDEF)-like protein/putative nucleotidyltransferase with HDIG domain
MDVLPSLAKLALGVTALPGESGALFKAMDLIQRRTGALNVVLAHGDDGRLATCALRDEVPLPEDALIYLQQRLFQLRVPLSFNLEGNQVAFLTRAAAKQRRDFTAWLIPSVDSWTEMLVLRGAWGGNAVGPLMAFVDSAMPALALILDRYLDAGRKQRLTEQLSVISASVDALSEMTEVMGSVAAVVPGVRRLDANEADLLTAAADRALAVLAEVRAHRDLVETHLRLQEYTLDYTMRLERAVEVERYNATTDALTGLINHRGALQLLQSASELSETSGGALSLLMIDIDGFKLVNDTYGHTTGDAVLKLVADILKSSIGERGAICRFGGDEFIAILGDVSKDQATAIAGVISGRLSAAEFRPGTGDPIPVSASIGVATFPEDTRSPSELVAHADAAMYAAKKQVRSTGSVVVSGSEDTTFGVLDSLVQAIDAKDSYTRRHCDIVAEYAVKMATRMGLPEESRRALRVAGLLHDVGKLIVPDEILKKPGPLTIDEFDLMRRHVVVGEVLIREVPQLNEVIQAVACHHERYDGTGYPRGLRGENIPLIGRIIALADSYSAMRLDRPYRKGMSTDRVLHELVAGAGTQFDPALLQVFVELLLEEELQRSKSAAARKAA